MERKPIGKFVTSSSNKEENEGIHFNISGELQVEDTLKQEIYELEILNRHLKQENETLKVQNEIQRTKNDNILLHIGSWYKKNKKFTAKNKFLKKKVTSLKNIILMKKPRMTTVRIRKTKRTDLDAFDQVSKESQWHKRTKKNENFHEDMQCLSCSGMLNPKIASFWQLSYTPFFGFWHS